MIYGERIKQLRENQNMSQNDFAEMLSISRSSITKYERGEREPGLAILMKTADYFGVSMDYILGKTDEKDVNAYRLNKTLNKIGSIDINAFDHPNHNLNDDQKSAVNGLLYEYINMIDEDNPINLDFIYFSYVLSTAIQEYHYALFDTIFDIDKNGRCHMNNIRTGELIVINEAKDTLYSVFKDCANDIYTWILHSDIDNGEIYNIDKIVEEFSKKKKGQEFIRERNHIYKLFKNFKKRD